MNGKFELAERLLKLPPYLFFEIDRLKKEAIARGKDIIDLGVGDPDIPTPSVIVEELKKAVDRPANHRYPSTVGMIEFREAACDWFKNRFGVSIDPVKEAVALIGSKEGIANISMAFVDPGDYVLIPDPAYPVYKNGTIFAGGNPYIMPLLKENQFLPDLDAIPEPIAVKSKMMFLNYPNNPTSATATKEYFKKAVDFAHKYNIIVCHDAAYTEVSFDGYQAPSFLEVDGAKDISIEFHSLSKTFCMTGWRIGFALGNEKIVGGLTKIKSNIDSGAFQAVQESGIVAMAKALPVAKNIYKVFERRRNIFVKGLNDCGIECDLPKSTFYIWFKVPPKYDSASFTKLMLEEAGIVITPGNGFGEYGEGYVRAALTVPEERLNEAVSRIKQVI